MRRIGLAWMIVGLIDLAVWFFIFIELNKLLCYMMGKI